MKVNREKQRKKRKLWDGILNGITYASSGLSVFVLLAIFVFIFSKGFSSLGFDLLTGNYWAKSYLSSVEESYNAPSSYIRPSTLDENVAFSETWGIGLVDAQDQNKDNVILVEYIDEASPWNHMIDDSIKHQVIKMKAETGFQLERLSYQSKNGATTMAGRLLGQNAQQVVEQLDHNAESLNQMFFKTPGGGIKGSIISTLWLILVSLLIALPLGIAAAIYLHEYAKANRLTSIIRSAIELLTGVPSIIFGLMGVTVLFPLTQLFGADTTNILLGALTMSIILLPTIIRSTEEALVVVPQHLRDASLSVGANQSQTIFKVVLPCAVPGILTGVLLSIGRVIGESAALIYTMGTYVNDTPTLTGQGTSLAVHIYNIMSSEMPNFELASAISIVILVFVLVLNIIVKLLSRKLSKAWY